MQAYDENRLPLYGTHVPWLDEIFKRKGRDEIEKPDEGK